MPDPEPHWHAPPPPPEYLEGVSRAAEGAAIRHFRGLADAIPADPVADGLLATFADWSTEFAPA